ncbi:MAG: hypothetical protein HQK83_12570 [Fibrobacteria bacterium]|nr:hypothetical protein [Fibrobacteria bacterium]
MKFLVSILVIPLLVVSLSFSAVEELDITYDPTMCAILQIGQIVKGKHQGFDLEGPSWLHNSLINFGVTATVEENLQVIAAMEAATWYSTYPLEKENDIFNRPKQQQSFYIHQAQGRYLWGDTKEPSFQLDVGLFPYKYNQDVKNLGEYLFRTGTYPGYIMSEFGFNFARITGVKAEATFFDIWHNQVLLTTRTELQPFYDIDLTYLTDVTFGEVLTIGFGIQFAHLISITDSLTTPKLELNSYYNINLDTSTDTANIPDPGYYHGSDPEITCLKENGYIDWAGDANLPKGIYCADEYLSANSGAIATIIANDSNAKTPLDPNYYTFKGTKLMGRFALDLKPLIGSDMFGPEDLRIYGEMAVLGIKDYPVFYENIWDRIPMMIGINLPVFNILDHLAVELEWYGSPHPDNYINNTYIPNKGDKRFSAVPADPVTGDYTDVDYTEQDNWKWSIHATKTLRPGIIISAQAARDHLRHNFQMESTNLLDRESMLVSKKHWYWRLAVLFGF